MQTEKKMTDQVNLQRRKSAIGATLGDLVSGKILQRVQDWFAESSHISVVVRDPQGNRATKANYQNPFCKLVMESSYGETACRESYAHVFKRAARKHGQIPLRLRTSLKKILLFRNK